MGKGDKKTRRGKIISGTYGVLRPRKKKSAFTAPVKTSKLKEPKQVEEKAKVEKVEKPQPVEEVVKEVVEKKEVVKAESPKENVFFLGSK